MCVYLCVCVKGVSKNVTVILTNCMETFYKVQQNNPPTKK